MLRMNICRLFTTCKLNSHKPTKWAVPRLFLRWGNKLKKITYNSPGDKQYVGFRFESLWLSSSHCSCIFNTGSWPTSAVLDCKLSRSRVRVCASPQHPALSGGSMNCVFPAGWRAPWSGLVDGMPLPPTKMPPPTKMFHDCSRCQSLSRRTTTQTSLSYTGWGSINYEISYVITKYNSLGIAKLKVTGPMGGRNAAINRTPLSVLLINSKSCSDNRIFMVVINRTFTGRISSAKDTFSAELHLRTLYPGQPHCLLIIF